jgi:hypothetical protein
MTGVSAIQYYSVTIYGQIGISGANALKYQAINNIIALLGEGLCILLIDRLGRRRPLIIGNLANMVRQPYNLDSCMLADGTFLLGLLPHCCYIDRQIPTGDEQQQVRILGLHYSVRPNLKLPRICLTALGLGCTTSPSLRPAVPCLGSFPPKSSTPVLALKVYPSQPWFPSPSTRSLAKLLVSFTQPPPSSPTMIYLLDK